MKSNSDKTRNDETSDSPELEQDTPGRVWRDHLIMLLHIAAATEHALMVQYLYAAYSLDVDQKDDRRREIVRRWQRSIVAIAREEMGHLLTVQNILTLLGGPINLDREDFPWDAPYNPFPFALEPLSMESLSCYVFAEMPGPDEFKGVGKKLPPRAREFQNDAPAIMSEVKRVLRKRFRPGSTAGGDLCRKFVELIDDTKEPRKEEIARLIKDARKQRDELPDRAKGHRVGELYQKIIDIIEDPKGIPDSAFQGTTFGVQASWDDWGRGYQPDPRMLDAHGNIIRTDEPGQKAKKVKLPPPSARDAHVMIERVATRTQVVQALRRIAGQGEAPHLEADETGEPSHFERFIEIYLEFKKIKKKYPDWRPSYKAAANPSTRSPEEGGSGEYIKNDHSRDWATLFNLRYRILLTCLAHTFQVARVTRADEPNVRAMVMHRTFGEMYNLKALAGMLFRRPLGNGLDSPRAGPPFETPYSLRLPPTERDTWLLHSDLMVSAQKLCRLLLGDADEDGQRYLKTLLHLDEQSIKWINTILDGVDSGERQRV